MEKKEGLHPVAQKTVASHPDLYLVVDFLNKTLRNHHLMFGLTQEAKSNTMTISVYEV